MARSRVLSGQARTLLSALAASAREWRHGYDLARSTGLRSGTLYPLLIRLEAQGFLEARWQPPQSPGRPPRHVYRLTASGLALARDQRSEARSGTAQSPRGGREAYS